ncbi:glycosyl transferase [Vibrio inusitatus NBRC 102082]|uniref:Glycosyl transferase n=1 Tax=Vibrio inusitatus NBRC 102082 TaxID=1219070 RepID=A0A4Y3I0G0_9VIBR|nr:glycosyltransferase family 4 protein [Vibrio inusitatus]GEA52352.1 glycosyl transferase [Vibrio inusitatus NBRC 102082]
MRKKVFVLIASYPDSILSFRGSLIEALKLGGYEVHVIAPKMQRFILDALEKRSIVVHQVRLERTGLNPLKDLNSLLEITKVLSKVKPDKVLSYTIKPVIYGSIAAKIARVQACYSLITGLGYAFTGEASGKRRAVQKLLHFLYKLALSFNDKVFYQNPDDRDLFSSLGLNSRIGDSIVVNGSGVDTSLFDVTPLPDVCDFLLIARLLGDKGVREYASAAKKLKKTHPESVCRLVGWIDENPDAIEQQELDDWISNGYIEFLGKKSEVQTAISNSSVYVLPSYREGLPRTVLEAMAMGRPIITTDAPGCRETVRNGVNGFLVPVKDSVSIYDAMVFFIESPDRIVSMGKASREMVEQKFDVEIVNKQMLLGMEIEN